MSLSISCLTIQHDKLTSGNKSQKHASSTCMNSMQAGTQWTRDWITSKPPAHPSTMESQELGCPCFFTAWLLRNFSHLQGETECPSVSHSFDLLRLLIPCNLIPHHEIHQVNSTNWVTTQSCLGIGRATCLYPQRAVTLTWVTRRGRTRDRAGRHSGWWSE